MANALKKITAEAKRIRKAHPGKSWKNAVKDAGKKYRTGKIGQAKAGKVGVKRKKAVKRKRAKRTKPKKVTAVAVREVRAVKVGTTKRRRRSQPKRRMAGSGRRIGRKKSNLLPVLLAVGAGLLLWKALKPSQPTIPPGAPPLIQTSNTARNQQSSEIVQYAMAAGLTIDALSRLIQSLNSRGDQDVKYYYDEIDSGRGLPPSLYV